jgi:hypothetical protein
MILLRLFPSFVLVCAIVVTVVVEASSEDDGVPPNMNDMMNNNCPNFRCSKKLTPTQKSRTKFESAGCSAMGGGSMMMMGGGGNDNSANEQPFETCCHQWHACYQICGSSKKSCDDSFKTCSEALCGSNSECKKSANLNSMMLGFGGCTKFDKAQYKSCECVLASKAVEKRTSAIRSFYKKYAPENVDKAGDLAKKADTTGKMAGLLRKLVRKYPESIEKVEDLQQAAYRRMMEDVKEKKVEEKEEADSEEEEDVEEIEL